MKIIKELPLSIYNSLYLNSLPLKKMLSSNKNEIPIVVSLTSIPSRLSSLHLVIRSLMNQNVRPKKIQLWLHTDLGSKLPRKLKKLESDLFEIKYSGLKCSHRKLVHSLEEYPDDIVVTCDDDLMYRNNWLETLYKEHQKNPKKIIGNHCVHINHDDQGNPVPFKKWRLNDRQLENSKAWVPIGAWGVLYPPNSLSDLTTDSKLFLRLAPKADDLWFKAMALLKNTESIQANEIPKSPIPIGGTQKVALKKENLGKDKNTAQWLALNEHFKLSSLIVQGIEG